MDNGVPITEYADKRVGVYGGKFFPFHKGHVSFVMEAAKLVDVLFVALQYDEEYEKSLPKILSLLLWNPVSVNVG